jgi:cytochrome b6-f complex iron-sulfur subunit
MKRRDFANYCGLGLFAGCFPFALAACTSANTNSSPTASAEKPNPVIAESGSTSVSYETAEDKADKAKAPAGFKSVGSVADLDRSGQIKTKELLVVRDRKNSQKLIAVNPKCTHEGCAVDWKARDNNFLCPCHAAKFGTDGKVLAAPAPKPLKTYQARIVGGKVLVKV